MYLNSLELKLMQLIDIYTLGEISAPTFESEYFSLWREYRDSSDGKNTSLYFQRYVDSVFTALDMYCSNPDIRDTNDFDEIELYNEIIKTNNIWKDYKQ